MTVTDVPAARDTVAVLRDARAVVEPLLRAAIDRLDPVTRDAAGHHLGLLEVDGTPCSRGGKGVRGALALLGARAAGADEGLAAPAAAAVELVHEFSLVHDDLMDGDLRRRHRATVWARWGAPTAVLAGDALAGLAQEVVLSSSSLRRPDAALALARTVRALVAGQAEDLAFERLPLSGDGAVGESRCLAMVAGKTGSLLATAASLGALLAGVEDDVVAALAAYGAELGVAFQLVDDLLGLWGDPAVTGKPVGADLRAAKKTLPVVHAVVHGGAAGAELARRLDAPPDVVDDDHVAGLAELADRAGARDWALAEARRCHRRGERALAAAPPSSLTGPARGELLALGRHLVDRRA